jgi:hypothetical protein
MLATEEVDGDATILLVEERGCYCGVCYDPAGKREAGSSKVTQGSHAWRLGTSIAPKGKKIYHE